MMLNHHKINNYVIITPSNRIPGSRLLISSLPSLASGMHIESLGMPRDSTSVLKALLVNFISKDTYLAFSICHLLITSQTSGQYNFIINMDLS